MYLVIDGKSTGPFTLEQIRALWVENKIDAQTLYFREGLTEWQPLGQIVPELFPAGVAPAAAAPVATAAPVYAYVIPSFWRRFLGLLLDLILLGVVGFGLGTALFDVFVGMGVWGRLVGFVIAGLYFGLLDSGLGGGRTVGKMVMGLRVVGADGNGISLGLSFLRYSIWAVPYFLNDLPVSVTILMGGMGILLGLLLWVTLFALIYLLVFNRRTRQSLHDLLTHTYVVRNQPAGQIVALPVWKGHYAFIGGWSVLGVLGAIAVFAVVHIAFFSQLLNIVAKVEAVPDVQRAGVVIGTSYSFTNGQGSVARTCTITAYFAHPVPDAQKAAQAVAAAALHDEADIGHPDAITVVIARSYDIGIASGNWNKSVSKTPDQWRQ
jgi:uncharacterized RDD family membrane protein YckC